MAYLNAHPREKDASIFWTAFDGELDVSNVKSWKPTSGKSGGLIFTRSGPANAATAKRYVSTLGHLVYVRIPE